MDEELWGVLTDKLEGEARGIMLSVSDGKGIQAWAKVWRWYIKTGGLALQTRRERIMRPTPPSKESELMIHVEKWLRDLKEVDEQEEEKDRMSGKYRMVALKNLLGENTRIREYIDLKESEGGIKNFEDMIQLVKQWAESKRLEKLKTEDDMDIANADKHESTPEENEWYM